MIAVIDTCRIDDITIVSRRHQVLHIVADQWEENGGWQRRSQVVLTTDHAQWEIKLGDDALMNAVRASFTGQELKITGGCRATAELTTVQRTNRLNAANHSVRSNVTMRTASSRAAPSMAATLGHTHGAFPAQTETFGEQERHELEARMTRGTAAMGLM